MSPTLPDSGYSVDERSLLFPWLKRHVWSPMLAWIPRRASANTLTLLGALLSASASAALIFARDFRVAWALAAFFYFAYLCLDNLDGPQARRTTGGTRLGEVLDHWLDALSGMLLFAAQLWTFQFFGLDGLLVMALAAGSYLATFWEQRVTGTMVLGAIGYVEGLVMLCGFCLLGAAVGPGVLEAQLPVIGVTLTQIAFVSLVTTLTWTILAAAFRVRRSLGILALLLSPPAALFAWAALGSMPFAPAVALFVLLTPAIAGRLLIAKVSQWQHFGVDIWLTGAIGLVSVIMLVTRPSDEIQSYALWGLVVFAGIRVASDFASTLGRHRTELHPRELFGRLLGVTSAESRVEAGWPSA